MKYIYTFLLFLITLSAYTQQPKNDILKTKKGDITIQPILHGTLVLQFKNKTIYVDPYGGEKAFSGITKPDIILITDVHGDHLNTKTLEKINTQNAIFIVPLAVADKLSEIYHKNLKILKNGEKIKIDDIHISAIPMYNLPISADAKHTKGRGNGYVLTMGKKKIYISGDTEDIPEMRQLSNIDVAFICMNLPYTMDIYQASSAVLAFQPKIVYPYHYRGKPDMSDTKKFKELVQTVNPNIEVRLRNWYPKYD